MLFDNIIGNRNKLIKAHPFQTILNHAFQAVILLHIINFTVKFIGHLEICKIGSNLYGQFIIGKRSIGNWNTMQIIIIAFFALAAGREFWEDMGGKKDLHFFETVYTALIFSDIAVVLLAQQFMPSFHAVFRNSGFVMGTLLMRLSFSAEHPLDIAVSLFATLYVLALTYAVNRFPPSLLHNVSEDGDDKPEP